MSPITSQRPGVYRRSSYGALGVIGLCWTVLWKSLTVIGLVAFTAIGMMVGLGIISLSEISNILNPFVGRTSGGSGI